MGYTPNPRASRQMGYTLNRHDTNGLYPFSDWFMHYFNFGYNEFDETFFSVHR